eukprot:COSAG04_NODE_2651_length_3787_cov_2.405471_8_plen_22_part_01
MELTELTQVDRDDIVAARDAAA